MPANLRVQISSTFSVKTVSLRMMSSAELNSVGIFKYKRLWPRKVPQFCKIYRTDHHQQKNKINAFL